MSDIIQNMSDIFRNMCLVFFICSEGGYNHVKMSFHFSVPKNAFLRPVFRCRG